MLHTICQEIWKTQQWAQDWKKVVFIAIPKKGNAKECSHYHTIILISHTSKVMFKILQVRINSMWTKNFQMFKLDLEKAGEPKVKFPRAMDHWKSKRISGKKKTYTSPSLTMLKPLTLWITTNSLKFLKEIRIPDHLTCLLRNLHTDQEATVRTGHGTTDWLQIGKGVGLGCILSLFLFNL